jgi:hypothetical protein
MREKSLPHMIGIVVFARLDYAVALKADEKVVTVGVMLAIARDRIGLGLNRNEWSFGDYGGEFHIKPVGKPALHYLRKPLEELVALLHLHARCTHHELEFEFFSDKPRQNIGVRMVHLLEKLECTLLLGGSFHLFLPDRGDANALAKFGALSGPRIISAY